MANIETLKTRVENTTTTIEKKENSIVKKYAQIEKKYKALEKLEVENPREKTKDDFWDLRETNRELHWNIFKSYCDIESLQKSIVKTTEEIQEKKVLLNKYKEALETELAKESEPKIQELVNFLETWKQKAREYYISKGLYGVYGGVTEEDLENEAKAKYQDLIMRISEVTGNIKEIKRISIANDGSINGLVIGEKAKAEVETIMAGGYNIQCLHYRVLVKKIK